VPQPMCEIRDSTLLGTYAAMYPCALKTRTISPPRCHNHGARFPASFELLTVLELTASCVTSTRCLRPLYREASLHPWAVSPDAAGHRELVRRSAALRVAPRTSAHHSWSRACGVYSGADSAAGASPFCDAVRVAERGRYQGLYGQLPGSPRRTLAAPVLAFSGRAFPLVRSASGSMCRSCLLAQRHGEPKASRAVPRTMITSTKARHARRRPD